MSDNSEVVNFPVAVKIGFEYSAYLVETTFQAVHAETHEPISEKRGWYAKTSAMYIDYDEDEAEGDLTIVFKDVDPAWKEEFLHWMSATAKEQGIDVEDQYIEEDDDDWT